MTKYVFSAADARRVSKHGIELQIYGQVTDDIDFKRVSVAEGHFEEFKSMSWFIYYILEGSGIFILNDEHVPVEKGDLVSVPPDTRIHYFGKLEFTLMVSPPWKQENETHIRDVDPSENPLR